MSELINVTLPASARFSPASAESDCTTYARVSIESTSRLAGLAAAAAQRRGREPRRKYVNTLRKTEALHEKNAVLEATLARAISDIRSLGEKVRCYCRIVRLDFLDAIALEHASYYFN